MIETERLILRLWRESDAEALYKWAKDPEIGPAAGWAAHKSADESREVIKRVLSGPECYAVCLKGSDEPVGAAELMQNSALAKEKDECELGYWIAKPYWGRGLIPEASRALLRRAFCELGMNKVFCGYYEGNARSARVQIKLGFRPHGIRESVDLPALNEKRKGYDNLLTREEWERLGAYRFITLREMPQLEDAAAEWFHSKWHVPKEAYTECMDAYLARETEYGWYLCLYGDRIAGGLGVIENDFHDRKDLKPNICAVFTEEAHRGRGIAGRLLDTAVEDLRTKGTSPVYLVTDHIGFYERYGWEYYCPAQGDGEDHLTRVYIHR